MSGTLHCYSFHSVKGGVGKSTLATLAARYLARKPEPLVYLIDMDLTGTSLADVLPLLAPDWGAAGSEPLQMIAGPPPGCFLDRETTRRRMEARRDLGVTPGRAFGVPFLNDHLLFATPDWDEQKDVHRDSLLWRFDGGPQNLSVIPSSALPEDLERILPVVFDEHHSAFLEGRLEYLLASLVPDEGEAYVVVDTPPTIPGLSRSVMSLALRLGATPKLTLSQDGGMPARLEAATIDWRVFLVMTEDFQDVRAAARWLQLVKPEEEKNIRVVVNRTRYSGAPEQRQAHFQDKVLDIPELAASNALLDKLIWMDENISFQLFGAEGAEKVPPDLEGVAKLFVKPS